MVEIYETKAKKDGYYLTLKFTQEELDKSHGWDYMWHLKEVSHPPGGLKELLVSVARKLGKE